MLTKIISRSCIFIMLTLSVACLPEEVALPKSETDALLLNQDIANIEDAENANIRLMSQAYKPTGCTLKDCDALLPELSKTYKEIANATCKVQWYIAACCLEGNLAEIQGYVEPDNPDCFTGVAQNEALAVPIPTLAVAVLPNYCINAGATLWAINPKKPGNPPYSCPTVTVKWYANGELIGNGAYLSNCICDKKVEVSVLDTTTGAQGSAIFIAPPCDNEF